MMEATSGNHLFDVFINRLTFPVFLPVCSQLMAANDGMIVCKCLSASSIERVHPLVLLEHMKIGPISPQREKRSGHAGTLGRRELCGEQVERRLEIVRLTLFHKMTKDNDLWDSLFDQGDFSDMTLKCEEKVWKVHKALLSCKCGFFKNHFYGNFEGTCLAPYIVAKLGSAEVIKGRFGCSCGVQRRRGLA